MNCNSCGKRLKPGAIKCPRCGKPVESADTESQESSPTSTLQLPEMSGPSPTPVSADPNSTFQAPSVAIDDGSTLPNFAAPVSRKPASPALPDQTLAGSPPPEPGSAGGDTGQRHATVINRDSQSIRQVWKNLADSDASPVRTFKAESLKHAPLESMVIQRRSLKSQEDSGSDHADYQLLRFLGEGGMGTVYEANQSAVQRRVAVKTLKPEFARRQPDRTKFLNEAKITGDLDHPNIVPIHDLGISDDGTVFYSMKLVGGKSWEAEMRERSRSENLDILLKVCDAIAFAHSRHVIHRDLKPENIMLGEFGEVLVMDWGLAINLDKTSEFVLGGTPAYMAPEMAIHDLDRIGYASDIYLLSAMLYEIVSGFPPHPGSTVTECVSAAAKNSIIPVEIEDELLDIALTGMATNPGDRYANVAAFRNAVVEYQSHEESIKATDRGFEELERADAQVGYETFARAVFSFQDAIELWPSNARANSGLATARIAYARRALKQEDFDLGLSLISGATEEEAPVYRELTTRSKERATRQRRLRIARWVATASGTIALVTIGAAALIRSDDIAKFFEFQRTKNALAQAEQDLESKNAQVANAQTLIQEAENKKAAAEQLAKKASEDLQSSQQEKSQLDSQMAALKVSETNLKSSISGLEAEKQQRMKEIQELEKTNTGLNQDLVVANNQLKQQINIANARKNAAQLGQYQSDILLARALIDDGKVSRALDRLNQTINNQQIPPETKGWELHRLYQLCHQTGWSWEPPAEIVKLWSAPHDQSIIAIAADGQVYQAKPTDAPQLDFQRLDSIVIDGPVGGVAISDQGRYLAVGLLQSANDNLQVWDLESRTRLASVKAHETDVRFVAFLDDSTLITAGNLKLVGQYARWKVASDRLVNDASFFGDYPIQVAKISPSRRFVVVGCSNQRVRRYSVEAWDQPQKPENFGDALVGMTGDFADIDFDSSDPAEQNAICGMTTGKVMQLFAETGKSPKTLYAHNESVTVLNTIWGAKPLVVSASDDETIRVFDLATASPVHTITGHRGRVVACANLPAQHQIVGADTFPMVRIWSESQTQDEIDESLPANLDLIAATVGPPNAQAERSVVTANSLAELNLRDPTNLAIQDSWRPAGHQSQGSFSAAADASHHLIVTGAADGQLICRDVATAGTRWTVPMHRSAVFGLSADGTRLLFLDPDNRRQLIVADPQRQQELGRVELGHDPKQVVISTRGRLAAVICDEGNAQKVQFVDLQGIQIVGDELHFDILHSLVPTPDDGFVVCDTKRTSAITERRVERFLAQNRDKFRSGFDEQVMDCRDLNGQRQFLSIVVDSRNRTTRLSIWDDQIWSNDSQPLKQIQIQDEVLEAYFVPQADQVLLTNPAGDIKIWNPPDGSVAIESKIRDTLHTDFAARSVPFDLADQPMLDDPEYFNKNVIGSARPVGDRLLVTGAGYSYLLKPDGTIEHRVMPDPVATRVIDASERQILVRYADGRVWLVQTAPDGTKNQFKVADTVQVSGYFRDAVPMNNGATIILIGDDQQLYQYDVGSRKLEQFHLEGRPNGTYRTLATIEDESKKWLAAADQSGEIVVCSWPKKETIMVLEPLEGSDHDWWKLVVAPDNKTMVAVSRTGAGTIWALVDGSATELARPPRDVPIVSVGYNPAANRIVLGRADSSVSVLLISLGDGGFANQKEKLGSGIPEMINFTSSKSQSARPVYVAFFSADGRELITSTYGDGRLVRWLTSGWDLEKPYTPEVDVSQSASPSPSTDGAPTINTQ